MPVHHSRERLRDIYNFLPFRIVLEMLPMNSNRIAARKVEEKNSCCEGMFIRLLVCLLV